MLNVFRQIDCPLLEQDKKRKVKTGQTNISEKQKQQGLWHNLRFHKSNEV